VHQLLSILVGNALKFTASGSVTAEAYPLPDHRPGLCRVLVSVSDTGIGIVPGQLEQLFRPFSQGDDSFTRRYQGAGLGLSIVKRLVTLMDGTITVDSAPDEGTTICLCLSFALPAGSPVEAFPCDITMGRKLSLLLVEDDATNRIVGQQLLQRHGFDVMTADNAELALETLRSTAFDVLLLDIQLPGIDGVALLRMLRSNPDYAAHATTPAIAMTAYAGPDDDRLFLSCGFDGYLAKPYETQALLHCLRSVVEKTGTAASSSA